MCNKLSVACWCVGTVVLLGVALGLAGTIVPIALGLQRMAPQVSDQA